MTTPDDDAARRDPLLPARLAAAWTIVGLPLLWGVSQVLVRALDLFRK